jgi:hypothetical protein
VINQIQTICGTTETYLEKYDHTCSICTFYHPGFHLRDKSNVAIPVFKEIIHRANNIMIEKMEILGGRSSIQIIMGLAASHSEGASHAARKKIQTRDYTVCLRQI